MNTQKGAKRLLRSWEWLAVAAVLLLFAALASCGRHDSYVCNAESCPDGCCRGNVCYVGNTPSTCGLAGAACTDCGSQACHADGTCGACFGASHACSHDDECCSTTTSRGSCEQGYCSSCVVSGESCAGTKGPRCCTSCQNGKCL